MPVVDADAHIDETDETWEYMDEEYVKYKPITVTQTFGESPPILPWGYNRYWFVDGKIRVRRYRDDVRTASTTETRELLDVQARLAQMDELGIDVQVIYPTSFLMAMSEKPEVEAALRKSYNRWMARKWRESNNRLRWVALLPMTGVWQETFDEMRFAKDNGACGILKKGIECGDRAAGDSYFFPLYQEAKDLDMPVCMHVGTSNPNLTDADMRALSLYHFTLPVLDAFLSLVMADVPDKFPGLRFGFIEAMSSWVPYLMAELKAREVRTKWSFNFDLKSDLLKDCDFYVACQTVEDLPYLMRQIGEDNLMAGTDYSHADSSAEIETLSLIHQMGESASISPEAARKIRDDNPTRFYGL